MTGTNVTTCITRRIFIFRIFKSFIKPDEKFGGSRGHSQPKMNTICEVRDCVMSLCNFFQCSFRQCLDYRTLCPDCKFSFCERRTKNFFSESRKSLRVTILYLNSLKLIGSHRCRTQVGFNPSLLV